MSLPFNVASFSQAKQGGIIRSPPNCNWATRPILLRLCQWTIVDEDVLIRYNGFIVTIELLYNIALETGVTVVDAP